MRSTFDQHDWCCSDIQVKYKPIRVVHETSPGTANTLFLSLFSDQTFTRNLRKVCIGSTCLKGRTTRQEWHVVNSEAVVPKSLGQGEGEATII